MVPDVTISSIRTVAMVIASSLLQSVCYCQESMQPYCYAKTYYTNAASWYLATSRVFLPGNAHNARFRAA